MLSQDSVILKVTEIFGSPHSSVKVCQRRLHLSVSVELKQPNQFNKKRVSVLLSKLNLIGLLIFQCRWDYNKTNQATRKHLVDKLTKQMIYHCLGVNASFYESWQLCSTPECSLISDLFERPDRVTFVNSNFSSSPSYFPIRQKWSNTQMSNEKKKIYCSPVLTSKECCWCCCWLVSLYSEQDEHKFVSFAVVNLHGGSAGCMIQSIWFWLNKTTKIFLQC